jgi:chitinase
LYGSSKDVTAEQKTLNVDAAVDFWLSSGCPKEKLILGIPLYGRSFTLADVKKNGVGERAAGPGIIGSFVPESGFLPYNEICYTANSWNRFWEAEQAAPYAVKNNQWVGYEDLESLEIKLNYILARDLGGAMFWSVETDDFSKNSKEKSEQN